MGAPPRWPLGRAGRLTLGVIILIAGGAVLTFAEAAREAAPPVVLLILAGWLLAMGIKPSATVPD